MSKPFMPTGSDCEAVIRSMGVFDTDDLTDAFELLDTDTFAAAAVAQWETETGWRPFLADVDEDNPDQTRYFDPPGPNFRPQTLGGGYSLDLGTGLVVLETVNTGYSSTDVGTERFAGTDFDLYPYNADVLEQPWTRLEFLVPQWGARHSIRIVGRFGYSNTVPEDVWLAISHQAVRKALPELIHRAKGGLIEWKQAETSERYGDEFLGRQDKAWSDEWKETKRSYMRVVI